MITDFRQRAIVKVHYFGHGGGGAGALRAHVRYVSREGDQTERVEAGRNPGHEHDAMRAHTEYLDRGAPDGRETFYDALTDEVDGAARCAVWAREDKRHFRVILSTENGASLGELRSYTRAVMEEAERSLSARLEWVAIDHWDTDNPHTHIIVRGRRANGRPLLLPRAFVREGWRDIARNIATERLGVRDRGQEMQALAREARAHRPSRLDAMLAPQIDAEGRLKIADARAPGGDPDLTRALKSRARELARMGLAREVRRQVLVFQGGWREALSAIELHLDIRKRLTRERASSPAQTPRPIKPSTPNQSRAN